MKRVLVTGANAAYFGLLDDWLSSIQSFPELAGFDIVVLDLGLDAGQSEALARRGARTMQIGWDVDFPGRESQPSHYKAMTSRPFLPNHLPDHDVIMWLDSDLWVQEPRFLELYFIAAERYGFAVTPELDRSYPLLYGMNPQRRFHFDIYMSCFGREVAEKLMPFPILNSGAFAIRRDHPIWASWQSTCRQSMRNSANKMAEQAALNLAVYSGTDVARQPHMLPAVANWVCSVSPPKWDADVKKLVEPNLPHQPIGLVHLAGVRGERTLRTTNGGEIRTGLEFRDIQKLR